MRTAPRLLVPGALRALAARGRGARGGGAGTRSPGGGPWGARREAAACPGLGGWGERGREMDKLTIISGCLFLAADIFAIASIANPDWINTGESAGERRPRGGRGRAVRGGHPARKRGGGAGDLGWAGGSRTGKRGEGRRPPRPEGARGNQLCFGLKKKRNKEKSRWETGRRRFGGN